MSAAFMGTVLVFSIIALFFVLYPVLRDATGRSRSPSRQQANVSIHEDRIRELEQDLENGTLTREQFDAAVAELDRDLLQTGAVDPEGATAAPAEAAPRGRPGVVITAAAVSAVAVPLVALTIYSAIGDQRAFTASRTPQAPEREQQSAPGMPQQHDQSEIQALAEQLRQRLEQNPGDPRGWVLYGRTMLQLENLQKAQNAFERAFELGADDDPNLLAQYADILAANTGNLQGKPEDYLERALELDPDNVRALWLAGTAAYNASNYGEARRHWEKLLDAVPADSEEAKTIRANLEQLPDGEG